MNTDRLVGHVKRIAIDPDTHQKKGYFFIRAEEGVDYFAHVTELLDCVPDQITEGVKVSFRPTRGERGPRAIDVTVEDHYERKAPAKKKKL